MTAVNVPLEIIEAVRKLEARAPCDGIVIVEADALMEVGEHGPRVWRLEWDGDSWHHWPSGTSGSLGEQLVGIAACYIHRDARRTEATS